MSVAARRNDTPANMSQTHWDNIYSNNPDDKLSWTEPQPRVSLALIREASPLGRIIDVGGGTSILVDQLLDLGYEVAVLDISDVALNRDRSRLRELAGQVRWIVADVTSATDIGKFDLWHHPQR
jgi:2-polyprenyl-3-methyl-5-hydroxy-6-metoxy-1,4-benzoquinol methylase